MVAEVTTPSLGFGYEIGRAVAMKKRVVCLFRKNESVQLSAMIGGSDGVTMHEYEAVQEASNILSDVFS